MLAISRRTNSPTRFWPPAVRRVVLAFGTIAVAMTAPATTGAQLARSLPTSLSDREFWDFFTSMSEEGGSFPSENFVSNEQTYQHVIPTLQASLTPGGVYLGVGPEQNFTYIANLKPRLAVIFDIRRQNAMAHLMYKALFELSPTRAEFISRLFSRPLPSSLGASATAVELFAAASAAEPSDSGYEVNRKAIADLLTVKHGFALTTEDLRSINHVYGTFFEAGPSINYGYRPGLRGLAFGTPYPNFAQLQQVTNAAGVNMAFLATEANYQALRTMHLSNLIVPVVGDFAGPKAIRSVGEYLKQRKATVTAFYLSNVEQYLFRQFGDAERFYRNVTELPIDSTSNFIRSVPPNRGFGPVWPSTFGIGINNGISYSVEVRDSAGSRITTTTRDSAGQRVTTRSVDSTRAPPRSPIDILRSLRARDDSVMGARVDSAARASVALVPGPVAGPVIMLGGRDSTVLGAARTMLTMGGPPLINGIASIRASLDAFDKGELNSYARAIAMTKLDGWK
jgi:hypothetical protein